MNRTHLSSALAGALLFSVSLSTQGASRPELMDRLTTATEGAINQVVRPRQQYSAVIATGDRPLLAIDNALEPVERATTFLTEFGGVMGVDSPSEQLKLNRLSVDGAGRTHVHLDQFHAGIPVFGARMVVHLDEIGATGVSGVFLEGLNGLDVAPTKATANIETTALALTRKHHPGANPRIASSRLVIYRTGLLQGCRAATIWPTR